jgi:hypothetical protein
MNTVAHPWRSLRQKYVLASLNDQLQQTKEELQKTQAELSKFRQRSEDLEKAVSSHAKKAKTQAEQVALISAVPPEKDDAAALGVLEAIIAQVEELAASSLGENSDVTSNTRRSELAATATKLREVAGVRSLQRELDASVARCDKAMLQGDESLQLDAVEALEAVLRKADTVGSSLTKCDQFIQATKTIGCARSLAAAREALREAVSDVTRPLESASGCAERALALEAVLRQTSDRLSSLLGVELCKAEGTLQRTKELASAWLDLQAAMGSAEAALDSEEATPEMAINLKQCLQRSGYCQLDLPAGDVEAVNHVLAKLASFELRQATAMYLKAQIGKVVDESCKHMEREFTAAELITATEKADLQTLIETVITAVRLNVGSSVVNLGEAEVRHRHALEVDCAKTLRMELHEEAMQKVDLNAQLHNSHLRHEDALRSAEVEQERHALAECKQAEATKSQDNRRKAEIRSLQSQGAAQ